MIFDVDVVAAAVAVVVVVACSSTLVFYFFSSTFYPLECTTRALKPRTSHP